MCFGPERFTCTSSLSVVPTKTVANLAREIPSIKGGANPQLLRLALALQADLIVFSGIVLLVLIVADLIANAIEIYFNVTGLREEHIKASVWARGLDWVAAAGAVVAFASYRSLIDNTTRLLQAAGAIPLLITAGSVASGLFAAVVGTTIAGAVINTLLTAGDTAGYAEKAGKGGDDAGSNPDYERFKDAMTRRRAAYEAFP